MTKLDRRNMLVQSGMMAGLAIHTRPASAAISANVLETKVISRFSQLYHGWPTLARTKKGELLVVCSGGREAHVCPFGRVELIRSKDNGKTWTFPRVLLDGPIDDRDAGIVETAKGSLLVTTFTSLAYEPLAATKENPAWQATHNRIEDAKRQA